MGEDHRQQQRQQRARLGVDSRHRRRAVVDESERRGTKQAANGNKKPVFRQLHLFESDNKPEPEWIEIDTANIRVENQLGFGGPSIKRFCCRV